VRQSRAWGTAIDGTMLTPNPEATSGDQQNFHEGMYDFYDEHGNLLRQIDMHSGIKWEIADDSDE